MALPMPLPAALGGGGGGGGDIADARSVVEAFDTTLQDVVIGGPSACFTVTGLRISNTRDALAVFEACRQGVLPRVVRRLNEGEKQQICAGTVVVFDEKEAKMKRWTDGRVWTPSRIMNNFLVYRELDRKLPPNQEGLAEIARWEDAAGAGAYPAGAHSSTKGVFLYKDRGLLKTTISLSVPDDEDEFLRQGDFRPLRVHQQHLISYFRPETTAQLPTPDDMEELQGLRLPLPILRIQRFRRPVKIEIFESAYYDIYDTEEEDDQPSPPQPHDGTPGKAARHAAAVSQSGGGSSSVSAFALPPSESPPRLLLGHSSGPPDALYGGDGCASQLAALPLVQRADMHLPLPAPHHPRVYPAALDSSSMAHYQIGAPYALGGGQAVAPSPLVLQPPQAVALPLDRRLDGAHAPLDDCRIAVVAAPVAHVHVPAPFPVAYPALAQLGQCQPLELVHPCVVPVAHRASPPDDQKPHP
ncbi:Global transcription regulator sge1 [Coemansia nantahalensis]|nr:Global transcription regulator sge1 [Coemansia nantahalensis]